MQKSYGVAWREGGDPVAAGKLELLPRALRLVGREGTRDISYEEVAGVRVGRSPDDRLEGRPAVVVELRHGDPVTISTVAQIDLVGEIAERLAALQFDAMQMRQVVVVLPLRPGAHEKVQSLLSSGPPFDPAVVPGLDRHQVFLTPEEAVFLFESSTELDALEVLLAEPAIWRAAAEWRDQLAGPPRIAEDAFSWSRPSGLDEMSFLATPGPGDSEGGDLY